MAQIGRSPGRRPYHRLISSQLSAITATALPAKASSGGSENRDTGVAAMVVNSAAGMARWKTNRPSTDAASSPSRRCRLAPYPAAARNQIGMNADISLIGATHRRGARRRRARRGGAADGTFERHCSTRS